MSRAKKPREVILLMQGHSVCANFSSCTDEQIGKTVEELNKIYGRDLEMLRFREVIRKPTKRVKK